MDIHFVEQSDFSERISDILPKVIADIIVKDIKRRFKEDFNSKYAESNADIHSGT